MMADDVRSHDRRSCVQLPMRMLLHRSQLSVSTLRGADAQPERSVRTERNREQSGRREHPSLQRDRRGHLPGDAHACRRRDVFERVYLRARMVRLREQPARLRGGLRVGRGHFVEYRQYVHVRESGRRTVGRRVRQRVVSPKASSKPKARRSTKSCGKPPRKHIASYERPLPLKVPSN
jgi:hypothetical protein